MQIVNVKNHTGGHYTEKFIIDPTVDFNKRPNMPSRNKKQSRNFQRPMILKASKKEIL